MIHNFDSFEYIRDFKNPEIRNYYYRNVRSSYGHIIELPLFVYLRSKRNSSTGLIPCKILEIGYGYDAIGLELLFDVYKVDPRFVVAIEAKKFIHDKNISRFNGNSNNLYLIEKSGEILCDLLNKFVKANVKFNFIYNRYLMDEIDHCEDIIKLFSQLLESSEDEIQYSNNLYKGVYSQKNRIQNEYNDLKNKYSMPIYDKNPLYWPKNSWQHLLLKNNLITQQSGLFNIQTQLSGKEQFLIATKGIE